MEERLINERKKENRRRENNHSDEGNDSMSATCTFYAVRLLTKTEKIHLNTSVDLNEKAFSSALDLSADSGRAIKQPTLASTYFHIFPPIFTLQFTRIGRKLRGASLKDLCNANVASDQSSETGSTRAAVWLSPTLTCSIFECT